MTDISVFGSSDDKEFARRLVQEIGIATVPGSSFYHSSGGGSQQIRFTFCKRMETLNGAITNLQRLKQG